jgi:hypothetical protein
MNRLKYHIRSIGLILLTLAICLTGAPVGARAPLTPLQSAPDSALAGTQALAALVDDLLRPAAGGEPHPRRKRRGRQGWPADPRQRLRVREPGAAHTSRRRPDPVPRRLGVEAVHLDGGDAARGARQIGSPRRRQYLPDRVPDPGHLPAADHAGAPAHAYRWLRGSAARYHRLQCRCHASAGQLPRWRAARPVP